MLDHIGRDLDDSQLQIAAVIKIGAFRSFDTGLKRLKELSRLECVIIAGGDGTIAGVLNALSKRTGLKIGLIPLGTGNSFARSVGLPLEYEAALSIIKAGKTKWANLASVNDHIFVNAAAVGLSAETAFRISDTTKRYFGRAAYLISGGRQLLSHKSFRCELQTPKETYHFKTHEVLVANGAFHGAKLIDHHTSVYKDYLTFIALGTVKGRYGYIKSQVALLRGRGKDRSAAVSVSAQTATITATPRQLIHADGEIVASTPAEFRIIKNAVQVFVP